MPPNFCHALHTFPSLIVYWSRSECHVYEMHGILQLVPDSHGIRLAFGS